MHHDNVTPAQMKTVWVKTEPSALESTKITLLIAREMFALFQL